MCKRQRGQLYIDVYKLFKSKSPKSDCLQGIVKVVFLLLLTDSKDQRLNKKIVVKKITNNSNYIAGFFRK